MKIELTKYDISKVLLKHLGITDYNDNIDPEDSDSRKRKIELFHDEIYWEGNPGGSIGIKDQGKESEGLPSQIKSELNLYYKITTQQNEIIRCLKPKIFNFVLVDWNYLEDKEKQIIVRLEGPKLLWYTENQEPQIVPWHKLLVYSKVGRNEATQNLESILEELHLKRFRDENAPGQGRLRGETHSGEFYAYCYINPDYPNGYWENHVLETKTEL